MPENRISIPVSFDASHNTVVHMSPPVDAIETDEDQQYRASAYSLLAALLRKNPDESLLSRLGLFSASNEDENDDLILAMSMLALSASSHRLDEIEDEYHQLFVGLGRGEVVPFGSWYLTGFLMEQPLSDLRDDLQQLGFERSENVREPEDHIAALCEVMSVMISDRASLETQLTFFNQHMSPWFGRFFNDLVQSESAVFYQSVARFGTAFIEFESEYFTMQN
ncbi:MAG: TorA maturation chaperone TorD [Gammaproteobacteria bacterium]|jgi:TorA maturation chaperone TorD